MRKITLADFSGGEKIAYAADDFDPSEWALLRGFILVKNYVLRSQPPLQRVGTESGFREIRPLIAADGTQYLVGIKDNGEVWYCTAPAVSATYPTVNATSWTRLTSSNGTATLTVATDSHFISDVSFQESTIASGRTIPALLINQSYTLGTGATAGPIFIWADSSSSIGAWRVLDGAGAVAIYPGYTPGAPSGVTATHAAGTITVNWAALTLPGSSPILGFRIYLSDGTLKTTAAAGATSATFSGGPTDTNVVVRAYNAYGETPFDAEGGLVTPAKGYVPHANVGAFWSGQMILGDIEYYRNTDDIAKDIPLSSSNSARIRNGIWFSNPDGPTVFDPLAVFTVGQPDSQITAMVVVPQGLLVFTKTISNDSGIFLLRGTSAGVVLEEELALNFTVELIRGGVGTRGFANAGGAFNHVRAWPATGTVCFLDENSLVWQTNTQSVTHISENVMAPQTSFSNTTDNIVAWDKYLLFSALNSLFVLREFGERGAWTEFVLPDTTYTAGIAGPISLQEMGNCVYFIWHDGTNKQVWRYNMQPTGTAQGEFGKINGVSVDLTMISRPVRGGEDPHEKTFWHRIGLRFRGTNTFAIKSITSAPYILPGTGQPVAPGAYTITNSPATSYPFPANYRGEKFYPAHGPSLECQVQFILQGSTEIEGVTLYVHGRKPNKP
jgi:hypothetical protein